MDGKEWREGEEGKMGNRSWNEKGMEDKGDRMDGVKEGR